MHFYCHAQHLVRTGVDVGVVVFLFSFLVWVVRPAGTVSAVANPWPCARIQSRGALSLWRGASFAAPRSRFRRPVHESGRALVVAWCKFGARGSQRHGTPRNACESRAWCHQGSVWEFVVVLRPTQTVSGRFVPLRGVAPWCAALKCFWGVALVAMRVRAVASLVRLVAVLVRGGTSGRGCCGAICSASCIEVPVQAHTGRQAPQVQAVAFRNYRPSRPEGNPGALPASGSSA